MRYTLKDDTFVDIEESGCNLNYVPKDNMNIYVTEDNIDFVEGFINKLGKLEDLMEKYGFENVEDLDSFIQSCIARMELENRKIPL